MLMRIPTSAPAAIAIPKPRPSEPRRIVLGVAIPVRTGALKDCTVTVRVQALGLQQRGAKPFVMTITPQLGWSPPASLGTIVLDGVQPVDVPASAKEVEDLLASEGLTWH